MNNNEDSSRMKHSPYGKISLIVGILPPIVFFTVVIIVRTISKIPAGSLLLMAGFILIPLSWLSGLILSIIGLTKKGYKKLIPLLSLILHIPLLILVHLPLALIFLSEFRYG